MKKPGNYCFACGPHNPDGLHLQFEYDQQLKRAETNVRVDAKYQGATGFTHGGIIATLLDEAMAKVNGMGGTRAVTLKLIVFYKKMVPVGKRLRLIGWRTAKRGRKLYLRAELRHQNVLLAHARGLFLQIS